MTIPPFRLVYEGDHRWTTYGPDRAVVAEHYGQGEVERVAPVEERSIKSHGHYFAVLHECWLNLPEDVASRFPTEDHFRKHGLIATGYRDERSIVCATKAEAARVAAFIRPLDTYAIVTVREAVVTVYTAKSQSKKAMGKDEFQRSKDDVLAWAAAQAGTTPQAAAENARRAA